MLIPEQKKGKEVDLYESILFIHGEKANQVFQVAARLLLHPNQWHTAAGSLSASFVLIDGAGLELTRATEKNDYIRIDIPGPGLKAGNGYDWVRVEKLLSETDSDRNTQRLAITIAACANPTASSGETAHFFEAGASSTFLVQREGNRVTASYHGRNEKANTDVKRATDKIRNALVASGAIAGLSELQWRALIKGFIQQADT